MIPLAAAALAIVVLAAPAGGHGGAFATRSSINHCIQGPRDCFKGRVSADHPSCVPLRRIVLYGINVHYNTRVVRRTKTAADGRWKILLPGRAQPGSWFAKVRYRDIDTPNHHHLCRGGRSRTIFIANPGGGGDG